MNPKPKTGIRAYGYFSISRTETQDTDSIALYIKINKNPFKNLIKCLFIIPLKTKTQTSASIVHLIGNLLNCTGYII